LRILEAGCSAQQWIDGWATQGYRRFRCGNCGKQFNERSVRVLNRAQYPREVTAVQRWRHMRKTAIVLAVLATA
jgi:hypothetical protein